MSDIDLSKFKNPQPKDDSFLSKGKRDGSDIDDITKYKKTVVSTKDIKPSQDAIYIGLALDLAIRGLAGGDLDSIVTNDNYILDGHHRWASTMFTDYNLKLNVYKTELNLEEAIPIFRSIGDAMGNNRGRSARDLDNGISVFDATLEDIKDVLLNGNGLPNDYDTEAAVKFYNDRGDEYFEDILIKFKNVEPGDDAPSRQDMPKIKHNQTKDVLNKMEDGDIDIKKPYTNESKTNSSFLKYNEFKKIKLS